MSGRLTEPKRRPESPNSCSAAAINGALCTIHLVVCQQQSIFYIFLDSVALWQCTKVANLILCCYEIPINT